MQYVAITGASSGIGAALAREAARRGAHVALLARRIERLQALADELQKTYPEQRFVVRSLDVAALDSIAPALHEIRDALGGLDTVIANAGITAVNRVGAGDFSKDEQVIQVNLLGAMATLDAAAALFRQQDSGRLAAVSSIAAFRGIPGSAAYSCSKAGLSSYVDTLSLELAKHGIGTTLIHPGFIETELAPGMDRYPFVIKADKAAQKMMDAIVAGKREVTVPGWPWRFLRPAMGLIPGSLVLKLFR